MTLPSTIQSSSPHRKTLCQVCKVPGSGCDIGTVLVGCRKRDRDQPGWKSCGPSPDNPRITVFMPVEAEHAPSPAPERIMPPHVPGVAYRCVKVGNTVEIQRKVPTAPPEPMPVDDDDDLDDEDSDLECDDEWHEDDAEGEADTWCPNCGVHPSNPRGSHRLNRDNGHWQVIGPDQTTTQVRGGPDAGLGVVVDMVPAEKGRLTERVWIPPGCAFEPIIIRKRKTPKQQPQQPVAPVPPPAVPAPEPARDQVTQEEPRSCVSRMLNPLTKMIDELLGKKPFQLPCPRRRTIRYKGTDFKTGRAKGGIAQKYCGSWKCSACRDRKRTNGRFVNVPLAAHHGTHYWEGRPEEWDAARNRISRAKVKIDAYCAVRAGEERRFVALVITKNTDRVPECVTACSGIDLAKRLNDAIERIPVELPKKTHAIQPGGKWKSLREPDAQISPDAPEKKQAVADLEIVTFKMRPIDSDEMRDFLHTVEDRYKIDLDIQMELIDNEHRGGDITGSIFWTYPENEDATEDIEQFLHGPELVPVVDDRPAPEPERSPQLRL